MNSYITLKDADVLSMDESTGDIVISVDHIPEDRKDKNIIKIHYVEDVDNILHEYEIADFDIDNRTASLKWLKQTQTDLLMEGPILNKLKNAIKPDLQTQLKTQSKKSDAQLAKEMRKLLARDLSSEGRDWKFYFFDSKTNKLLPPLSQARAKDIYQRMGGNTISDAVLNAVVTTKDNEIVRRGKEDLYGKHVKFTPNPDQEVKNTTENKSDSTFSDAILNRFNRIAIATDMNILDSSGKPVKLDLDTPLTMEQINSYNVKIKGQTMTLRGWLTHAVNNKLITESCDIDTVISEGLLFESPVIKLDDADIMNPTNVDFKDLIRKATEKEAENAAADARARKQAELKTKYSSVEEKFNQAIKMNHSPLDILEMLFDELVPPQSEADTVAGELVRAIVRIMYRDHNDGDKFFESYGIETCGSSAEYLFDNGFSEQIQHILDMAYLLSSDDDKYTAAIENLAGDIVKYIRNNTQLIYEPNEVDSREYSTEYIEENQPRYEFEVYGSDDIVTLVDNGTIDAWKLNEYVEHVLEFNSVYNDAEVSRPWSHNSTTVTVENLTKDGYDYLEQSFNRDPEGFWTDLVSEYSDELDSNTYDDDYSEE